MPQVSKNPISPQVKQRIQEILIESFQQSMKSRTFKGLISDVLTPTEQIMISKRITIAYLLINEYKYRSISNTLKVSMGTIRRVNSILQEPDSGLRHAVNSVSKTKKQQELFLEIEYMLRTLLPPKGKNWSQWRKNIEKKRTKEKKVF